METSELKELLLTMCKIRFFEDAAKRLQRLLHDDAESTQAPIDSRLRTSVPSHTGTSPRAIDAFGGNLAPSHPTARRLRIHYVYEFLLDWQGVMAWASMRGSRTASRGTMAVL